MIFGNPGVAELETISVPGVTITLCFIPSSIINSFVVDIKREESEVASEILTQGCPLSDKNFWIGLGDAPL